MQTVEQPPLVPEFVLTQRQKGLGACLFEATVLSCDWVYSEHN